jgi:hypothetical protein
VQRITSQRVRFVEPSGASFIQVETGEKFDPVAKAHEVERLYLTQKSDRPRDYQQLKMVQTSFFVHYPDGTHTLPAAFWEWTYTSSRTGHTREDDDVFILGDDGVGYAVLFETDADRWDSFQGAWSEFRKTFVPGASHG